MGPAVVVTAPEISKAADGASSVARADVRIWALLGKRTGDNRQIVALAEATGLSWKQIQLRFDPEAATPTPGREGELTNVLPVDRAALRAPWPDVVIAAGKRSAAAALWIKAQSSGRTRLVHIGRPWVDLRWFDLVVTTAQYGLPDRPNVIMNRMPLTAPRRATGEIAADLAALPRPRVMAIVGGDSPPLVLNATAAKGLAIAALRRAEASGGSLLVATSPRTSKSATAALRTALSAAGVPYLLSVFGDQPNRYPDFLAAADELVVTDDSASMVTEAAMTGAPVHLFRLPESADFKRWIMIRLHDAAAMTAFGRRLFDRMVAAGRVTSHRDLGRFTSALEDDGLLRGGATASVRAAAELFDAAERVRALAAAAA